MVRYLRERAAVERASRNLIRAMLAIFTIVVVILFQSAFWTNAATVWLRVILTAVTLIAYFRPHNGLLILAALTPLGQVARAALHSPARVAEALVLAFLTGALIRGWTLHRFSGFPSNRLQIAAVLFSVVVAASCIEQIWFAQMQSDYALPFLKATVAFASQNYVGSLSGHWMVFWAMLLLEGLALLIYSVHYCQSRPEFAPQLIRMALAGVVAAAAVNILFFIDQVLEGGATRERFVELLSTHRFSGHIGDVNAAGSFFVMGFFIALGRLTWQQTSRLGAITPILVIGIGLGLTKSRTAIAAAVLVGGFLIIRAVWLSRRPLIAIAVTLLLAGLSFSLVQYFPSRFADAPTVLGGIEDRWLFLSTTIGMLEWQPLFGVGVGQYAGWSVRFAPTDLLQRQGPDNAHNNFAQVAGELGFTGLVAFAAVLAISLSTRRCAGRRLPLAGPILAGLGGFILTWLGGHPLLVPEAAYPFWMTLAIVPGLLRAQDSLSWKPVAMTALAVVVLSLSIPPRIASKQKMIDFSRVTYGVSRDRVLSSRGTLFVPSGSRAVTLPLRVRAATPDRQIGVDLLVDDRFADIIRFTDGGWQTRLISFSPGEPRRFHKIELRIQDVDVAADGESPRSVRQPTVELGELKPVGTSPGGSGRRSMP